MFVILKTAILGTVKFNKNGSKKVHRIKKIITMHQLI